MKAVYAPEVFNVRNEKEAKDIILTPEGVTTEERWEKETPFLAEDICSFLKPEVNTLILDFGCGIGRISKELIGRSSCNVIGLDISLPMRTLSVNYVASDNFCSVGRPLLEKLILRGLKVDACVSLWVLQHCPRLDDEIALIKSILKPKGLLYILNNLYSAIPTTAGWVNDGANIKHSLETNFKLLEYSSLPTESSTDFISQNSFIAKLENS
jgi:SAM-dependent methyltransferase